MGWSPTVPPTRPGSYLNFKSKPTQVILPSAGGVVAIPFVSDWGPFETPIKIGQLSQYIAMYGDHWTPGRIAVQQAFAGEALAGLPGAGAVICYRFGGSAAAKATKALNNTTPAAALTLSARYEGTRGNSFSATVQTNATDGAKKDILIYEGSVLLEKFEGLISTDMVGAAALINAKSGWVTAASNVTGVALANVANSALTGGNDGTSLVSGDWTGAISALSSQDFAVIAPFDLTDTGIQASLKAFVQDQNNNRGKRFSAVVGGLPNELIAAAVTRANTMADENICTIGVGQFHDPNLNPGVGVELSTSQLAPRVAGILAARGIFKEMTYARFGGLEFSATANSIPSDTDIVTAIAQGVMIIGADGYPGCPLRIEQGVTTYVTQADADRDPVVFSHPKFVMTMQEFERRLKIWAIVNVITPSLAITKDTREFVVAYAQGILDEYMRSGVLQVGATAQISQNPPPQPTDNFINIDYSWTHARSVEQIRGTAYVV